MFRHCDVEGCDERGLAARGADIKVYCSRTLTPVHQPRGHVTSLLAERLRRSEQIQLVQEQMTECSF